MENQILFYMKKLIPKHQNGSNLFRTDKHAYVDSVLTANKNLEWVQRLRGTNNPTLKTNTLKGFEGEPDDESSTHLMSDDGKGFVFPQIIRKDSTSLRYLGGEDPAYDYAKETNTGIQLPQEQGTWFANNGYKIGTGVLNNIKKGVPYSNPKYKVPKHQSGSAIVNATIKKYNTPEYQEQIKFNQTNKRAKDISGRIDYSDIDPVTDILLGSGIGKGLIKGVSKVAGENLTGEEIKETLKSFGNMVKRGTYPLRHIGGQAKMQKLLDTSMESFRNPESIRRMQDLGIDSEKFLSSNPKVTSKPWGSSYSGISDAVNIDLDQLKKIKKEGYNLTDKVVMEHELSHRMQGHQSNPFLTDNLGSTFSKDKGIFAEPLNIDKRIIKELPMASDRSLDPTPLKSKDYFITGGRGEDYEDGYGIERFPYLMELKKEMLDAGVLKDRTDLVNPNKLSDFASHQGGAKNRIMSFIGGSETSLPILSKYMNKLPVVAGAALGVRALKGKEE